MNVFTESIEIIDEYQQLGYFKLLIMANYLHNVKLD